MMHGYFVSHATQFRQSVNDCCHLLICTSSSNMKSRRNENGAKGVGRKIGRAGNAIEEGKAKRTVMLNARGGEWVLEREGGCWWI